MKKVLLFVFASWLFWAGCYTVVKHPDLVDSENPQFSHQIYLTDDCQSCHGVQNPVFANSLNSESSPRLNYIYRNERWNYFYQSPWWERSMFGSGQLNSGNQAVDSSLPTSSSRSRFPGAGSTDNSTGGNSNTRIYQSGSSGNSGLMRSSSKSSSDSKSEESAARKPAEKKESRKAIRGSGEKKSEKATDSRKKDQK